MSALSDLPNIGKVLESHLLRIGIKTPEELYHTGAEDAFILIRMQVDPTACLHMLYGIQGAIDGVRYTLLSDHTRERLQIFYKTL